MPDIGDEVVLGYLNGDPTSPVILGSLYSSNHKPPHELTAENFIRGIQTAAGLKVELDDEGKVVTLATPAGNSVVMSDDDKTVVICDESGNTVTLSHSGIELASARDISINARGKVSIKGARGVIVESDADVEVEGTNVTVDAKMQFTGRGGAAAELSASGQTVVKGAMVMIN